jgi:AcrR family transcriptional regulator
MTKQHILEVSTKEFATYGYNGVSMNNLAKKLEVNKATIYYHYKDKKSLYLAVMTELIRSKRDELDSLLQDQTINGKEKFIKYIDLFLHTIYTKQEIVPLALREMANFGIDIQDGIENDFNIEIEYLVSILKELPLKENYKNIDPHLIKSMIFGTICSYFAINMSTIECKYKKDFKQNPKEILEYLNIHLYNFILDTICD